MIYDLQKASVWKRISAFLFDVILLVILAVSFCWALSAALGFDSHYEAMNSAYAKYEQEYGVSFNMTAEEYNALTEEEQQNYAEASKALSQDSDAVYAYNMILQLTILISTFGILAAFLALEFGVPMLLGHGRTLGKKIFGIAVMKKDGVRVNGVCMFIRTILGKFTIETMIPVMLIFMIFFNVMGVAGTAMLLLLLGVQAGMFLFTRTHTTIHDELASTVTVDFASQMIFDTREELIAYKEKVHAEQAARKEYP